MPQSTDVKCWTCYGEGVVSGLRGPEACRDCGGEGVLPSALVLTEWRLRELERGYERAGGDTARDVGWLVGEVRRAHHALMQILAASQDADANDGLLTRIKFLANDVLRVYPPSPE